MLNFLNKIKSIAVKTFLESDESIDIFRLLTVAGLFAMIVYENFAIFYLHHTFDPMSFGAGFTAILTGGGASVSMKAWAGDNDRFCREIKNEDHT